MSPLVEDSLAAGREAARRNAWRDAHELLGRADQDGLLEPADLQGFAEAAWWTGHLEQALALRERAYAAYSKAGQPRRAAQVAAELAIDHEQRAALSVSNGWLARAERLLQDEPEGVEHGLLALARGLVAMRLGDIGAAGADFARAHELASRFGDRSLEAMAQVFEGTVLAMTGQVMEGLALLDEATAAALSGELAPLATGVVYCVTIHSCQTLGDCGRAAEWTDESNRWCDRLDITGFPGTCRIHRAELFRLRGEWPKAEEQALQACEELREYDRWTTSSGYYEIGEIRRRRGDFAAAEEAYRQADELGRDPQPGLALLRLAQGKVETAGTAVKRLLSSDSLDPLSRAQALPAQVEIALAAGEIARAREAAAELEAIADRYRVGERRTPALEGALQLATGRIRLAERDWEGAQSALSAARETWDRIGAPYETAQARLLLGLAYRGEGDEDGAREELAVAKATYERLGAILDVQGVAELLGEVSAERTFVFTDIVGSTKLVEALGDRKWQKLLAWHDRTLAELMEGAGGEIIKHTGDGYFAAFERPAAAVEAAVSIQRALDSHEPLAPDVRIGIHSGGAFRRGEDDYGGEGVHVAARIGALAGGGEILVSRESLDGGSRFPFSDPRSETLAGFEHPVDLVAVDWR